MFIQVYRLLSTYSLVRPPRGSNVSGETLLEAIVGMQDIIGEEHSERKREMEEKIDNILDNSNNQLGYDQDDHDYLALPINPHALTVIAGYVSRKMRKSKVAKCCNVCFTALCAPENENVDNDREKLLKIKTYGYLLVPSKELYEIIYQVSNSVINSIQNNL